MAGGPASTLNHEVTSKLKTHVYRAEKEEEAGSTPPATTITLLHWQPPASFPGKHTFTGLRESVSRQTEASTAFTLELPYLLDIDECVPGRGGPDPSVDECVPGQGGPDPSVAFLVGIIV